MIFYSEFYIPNSIFLYILIKNLITLLKYNFWLFNENTILPIKIQD